jgi:hypothetical protein
MTKNRASDTLAMLFVALCFITARGQAPGATPKPETVATRPSAAGQEKIKVVFDDNTPGVVYVESNGERIRVNALKRTVENVTGTAGVPEEGEKQAATTTTAEKEESPYDFDKGDEPYDYRIVNVPTPRSVGKKEWVLNFTHRFTEKIDPISESAKDLFGLDSFGIASFGVTYGFTDKLYGSVYRSPLCQRGMCRTVEIGLGYNWLSIDKNSPIALATYASIEGNDNFTEEYTYNVQARLAARLGKRVYLFFSPAAHINSNGQRRFDPRPTDFFPPAPIADTFRLPKHGASFGFGGEVLITPNVVALVEVVPRTGFKLGRVRPIFDPVSHVIVGFVNESHQSYGFGIQRNVGKHSFALTFSNTQTTTTSRYNSSNLFFWPKHVTIGFNLTRRF